MNCVRVMLVLMCFGSLPLFAVSISDYRAHQSAKQAYEQGDYASAIQGLSDVFAHNPDHKDVAFNLGAALAAQGNVDDARLLVADVIDEHPTSNAALDALMMLGNGAMKAQKVEPAIESYKEILRRRPDFVVAKEQLEQALRLQAQQQSQQNQNGSSEQDQNESKDSASSDTSSQDEKASQQQEDASSEEQAEFPDDQASEASDDQVSEREQETQEQPQQRESGKESDKPMPSLPGEVLLNLIEQKEKEAREKYILPDTQEATSEFDW